MSDDANNDYRQKMHDLRLRVLDGQDPSADEMLLIVEDIRRGRRASAAPAGRAKKAVKGKKAEPSKPVDLNSILDQKIP